ncbi:MAG: efflux RND transporter periplasmic adaptor subunit [Betaproteobacteria bacterium]|nr:efflux RND transporter periplasmic adaptor subunit [Betaproteobacteria bacterium]
MPDNESEATGMRGSPTRPEPPNGRRRRLLVVLTLAIVVAAAGAFAYWGLVARYRVTTDDAYVGGNIVPVAPQTEGTVVSIAADNTDLVSQGQLLVRLDAADRRLALKVAESRLARAVREARQLYSTVGELKAELAVRANDVRRAREDWVRRRALIGLQAVSAEDLQHARRAYEAAEAAQAAARARLRVATAMTEGIPLLRQPALLAAEDRLRQAYLDLRRTRIEAPVAGYVAERTVQLGGRVHEGQPLMAIIPLDHLWVDANLKENQLDRVRIGQPVVLTSDVYGGSVRFRGRVEGLGAGTGSVFSVLPPQNASGNWIKIVQRVPVRIALDPGEFRRHPLRVGLSMDVSIDTHNLALPMLAGPGTPRTRYQTPIYRAADAPAERIIAAIVHASQGSAAR